MPRGPVTLCLLLWLWMRVGAHISQAQARTLPIGNLRLSGTGKCPVVRRFSKAFLCAVPFLGPGSRATEGQQVAFVTAALCLWPPGL